MSERVNFILSGKQPAPRPFHYRSCGLDNIYLLNGVTIADTAYGETATIHNLEALHRAIGLHIVAPERVMTGREFRFLRKLLGFSQSSLADAFGVDEQTIANYEKGKPTKPAQQLIKMMFLIETLPDDARATVIEGVKALAAGRELPQTPRRQLTAGWLEAA